jgi:hypothetical protein
MSLTNASATAMSPSNTETSLFSDLFKGKTIPEVQEAFESFIADVRIVPYSVLSPTHSASANYETQKIGREQLSCPHLFKIDVKLPVAATMIALWVRDDVSVHFEGTAVQGIVDSDTSEIYWRRRNAFEAHFWKHCRLPWVESTNRREYLCRAEFQYRGKTVEEVSNWITSTLEGIEEALAWTFHRFEGVAIRAQEFDEDTGAPFLATGEAAVFVTTDIRTLSGTTS